MHAVRARRIGWALSVALVGCVEARTEIVVRVDSELAWGESRDLQSVVLEVRRGGATGPLRSQRATALGSGRGRSALPMFVGVLETAGDIDTPIWVEALGCRAPNGCTRDEAAVVQRASARFREGVTLELPMLLASACVGVRCGADERCESAAGMCRPASEAEVRGFTGSDAGAIDLRDATTHDAADTGARDVGVMDRATDLGVDTGSWVDARNGELSATDAAAGDADAVVDVEATVDVDVIVDAATERCQAGMVLVPSAEFDMGSTTRADEQPVRRVRLSSYCLDRTEVTVAAYRRCPGDVCAAPDDRGDCNWSRTDRDDHPINCVDWNRARAYCRWRGGDLPTEAQWEYAARGTDGRAYPWGNEPPWAHLCWSGATTTRTSTCPVGTFPSDVSPLGCADMGGDVGEWVLDWYGPYNAEDVTDPAGAPTGSTRVYRGSAWNGGGTRPRSAFRFSYAPDVRYDTALGFRCASGLVR